MNHRKPNPKSLANLKPFKTSEEAREHGRRGAMKTIERREQKKKLLDDIHEVVTVKIKVPEPLYQSLKGYGVPITRKESIDKVVFYRALLKAIKDGNADQLLKIAEFAGMKFTEEETTASTMTPDTELMLSTRFAQGRKVELPPQVEATAEGDAELRANGDGGSAPAEPSITVFSGLG